MGKRLVGLHGPMLLLERVSACVCACGCVLVGCGCVLVDVCLSVKGNSCYNKFSSLINLQFYY